MGRQTYCAFKLSIWCDSTSVFQLIFDLTNQKTVFWWRHRKLQIILFNSVGPQTPYGFELWIWYVTTCVFQHIFDSTNQKTAFWWRHRDLKMLLSNSTGPKTPFYDEIAMVPCLCSDFLILAHFQLSLAHCAAGCRRNKTEQALHGSPVGWGL